ncbi:Uncharacterised protein [Bordetella pertussis]|nr:Uncharacterised protein [Bordetella pertussis]
MARTQAHAADLAQQGAAVALDQARAPRQPGRNQDGGDHQRQADDNAQDGGFGHEAAFSGDCSSG